MANEFGVEMQGCGAQGVILFARLRKPIQERRLKRNRVSKERSAVFDARGRVKVRILG
jgi:hypothetical protein